jgi:hypothetical protein
MNASEAYYKALDSKGRDNDLREWPLPTDKAPGDWLTGPEDPLEALDVVTLRHLLRSRKAESLFRAEVRGSPIDAPTDIGHPDVRILWTSIPVREARLLYRIDAWNAPNAIGFACDCIDRALSLISKYPSIEPPKDVAMAIKIARELAAQLAIVTARARPATWDELLIQYSSARSEGKVPANTLAEIDALEIELSQAAQREFFEYRYLLEAAQHAISLGWHTSTFRAANRARDAIAHHRLRLARLFPRGWLGASQVQINEADRFMQAQGAEEEEWQANHLAEIIHEDVSNAGPFP